MGPSTRGAGEETLLTRVLAVILQLQFASKHAVAPRGTEGVLLFGRAQQSLVLSAEGAMGAVAKGIGAFVRQVRRARVVLAERSGVGVLAPGSQQVRLMGASTLSTFHEALLPRGATVARQGGVARGPWSRRGKHFRGRTEQERGDGKRGRHLKRLSKRLAVARFQVARQRPRGAGYSCMLYAIQLYDYIRILSIVGSYGHAPRLHALFIANTLYR